MTDPRQLVLDALDPHRSVVVEACAGSGKTWLLASRIVRLLLEGAAPGDILAITFTRKAAREIEERVMGWLRDLAAMPEAEAVQFLAERGMTADAALLRRARGLYERVADAQPPLSVHTFHGWFLQLVAAAPLASGLAGSSLVESSGRLLEELWQSFAAELQADPEGELAGHFTALLQIAGLDGTRGLLMRLVGRRAEWLSYTGGRPDGVAHALEELQTLLGVGEPGEGLAAFFVADWEADFHAYLGFLEQSDTKTDQALVVPLRGALQPGVAPEAAFEALGGVLLTQSGTLRARKPSGALDKRFGSDGAARFLALHQRLGESILATREVLRAEQILAFNRHGLSLGAAFLERLEKHKQARRLIDFVDAEWQVLQLLRDDSHAAFLQARLDARYKHILLDEFQDTNPLQWQILLAWLDAYRPGDGLEPPRLFLVGDPKQSIYRFRQAEPRLFATAADFLEANFSARRLAQDATRRNAPAVVEVVNALFGAEPAFTGFRPQDSLAAGLPGRVELLPLVNLAEEGEAAEGEGGEAAAQNDLAGLRNPLTTPAATAGDPRREEEAARLAARLLELKATLPVRDGGGERPLRWGDVMLLVRKRTQLAAYERALKAAGIPYLAASRGGLLHTLEARDLAALLEFLVLPAADLALVQVLRSPICAVDEADLLILATLGPGSWWERLTGLAMRGEAPPRLARAHGLLAGWLAAADVLPGHDLLDRVFHEGEVLARYREAVPEALWPGVEANLLALLQLALDLDGGRYPSLPRFLDELTRLREADPDEAPDEGIVEASDGQGGDDDQGRVRILTIHAAKGLEAPLVWLLDANTGAGGQADAWNLLVDWPPEAERPTHLSLYGRKDERGAAREPLFAGEAALAEREELNLLYVAITRAKQMFVASGSAPKGGRTGGESPENSPYQRLLRALEKLAGPVEAGMSPAYGDLVVGGHVGQAVIENAAASDPSPCLLPGAPAADLFSELPELPPIGERRLGPGDDALHGILLHGCLERLTAGLPLEPDWWRRAGGATATEAGAAEAVRVAERLMAMPSLAFLLDPALPARNEAEICDGEGRVKRVDRLVETPEAVWVVDYKSSGADTKRLAEYRRQVAEYRELLTPLYAPRPVRAALLFGDGELREVEENLTDLP
ncbi:double-strand break repair helicase AddA [Azospira sp. I13]|uniref:UvrD-helicase domain-containing protein n=1 Tax=Azospira sp. I13 TaxID=1765050 RepID=UPI000D3F7417|nr:UvrD-helicase domain-containing protein [Azospira sp. I13]GBG00912.1 double-strand break repair helicase AddA [Azospira sp. I13]